MALKLGFLGTMNGSTDIGRILATELWEGGREGGWREGGGREEKKRV